MVREIIKQPYGEVRQALDRAVLWKENEGQICRASQEPLKVDIWESIGVR